MPSIGFRLTTSYALALSATMIAFGAAVYWERTASTTREAELQLDERLIGEVEFTKTALEQVAKRTGTVVSGIRILGREADTSWVLANEVRSYLEGLREYLW